MCENIKSAVVFADSKVRLRDRNEDLFDLFPDALQEICEAYHCLIHHPRASQPYARENPGVGLLDENSAQN